MGLYEFCNLTYPVHYKMVAAGAASKRLSADCWEKISTASEFLLLVNCVCPASSFRHQDQSGPADPGLSIIAQLCILVTTCIEQVETTNAFLIWELSFIGRKLSNTVDRWIHSYTHCQKKSDIACMGVGDSQFGRLERKLSTLSTLWLVQTEKKFFKDLLHTWMKLVSIQLMLYQPNFEL
jgi:hypothetical protein